METSVNGKDIEPIVIEEGVEINWADHRNSCGAHTYDMDTQTLTWIMNTQNNCLVKVNIKSVVKVTMRLDIPVADFYKDIGTSTFVDRVAALLGISFDRIRIVGVKEGSTILDYYILAKILQFHCIY